ncbi:MAG: hypothetical protein ACD_45C00735G0001 [uncultured bacterium]|nr:MAG: hypothetical protein ACD_45C00735G0001 [uncultured bacterium]
MIDIALNITNKMTDLRTPNWLMKGDMNLAMIAALAMIARYNPAVITEK